MLTCDRACIGCVSRLGSEHLTSPQPRLRGSRKSNAREGCCHVISLSPAQSARRHGPELRRQLLVVPRLAKACHSAAIELCPMRSSAASAALPAHGRCLLQSPCDSEVASRRSLPWRAHGARPHGSFVVFVGLGGFVHQHSQVPPGHAHSLLSVTLGHVQE